MLNQCFFVKCTLAVRSVKNKDKEVGLTIGTFWIYNEGI